MPTPMPIEKTMYLCVEYKHVDGWHVFSSKEVEGLYVASADPEHAYNDVARSIQMLLELNEGLKCEVVQELTFSKFLRDVKQADKVETHPPRPLPLSNQRFAVTCM